MKLVRFGDSGAERPGLVDDEGRVRDLSAHVDDIAGDVLTPAGLARLADLDVSTLPLVDGKPQSGLRLGPCVGRVGKFLAIGLNYADHAAEANLPIPAEPIIFTKWTSCISGPDDDVIMPPGSTKLDWELELGIVIGTPASRVDEAHALDHVAGYCIVNDVSEREWQLERGGSWDKGKGHDSFGPIGPWMVTAEEITDPGRLAMELTVDGVTRQQGTTANLIFSVAKIVSYCSRFTTLQPGDVITTGTPAGVGMGYKPPVFLRAGQVMRLEIAGLGVQTQRVVQG